MIFSYYIFTALSVTLLFTLSTSYTENFQARFEKSFKDSCLKYDFISEYWSNLEKPSNKYVVVVMSEHGINHGGLGDRLGGLVTAVMIAIRFKRTLLIESVDGFTSLFRPYRNPANHEADFYINGNPENKYTYLNWTSWTSYDYKLSNNDATEYDQWYCVNMNKNDAKCGMDHGDVAQPIIKFRINRSYLCKWMSNPDLPAHKDLLGIGLKPSDDMMEVAGCALRLAMWPTEALWAEVEKLFFEQILPKTFSGGDVVAGPGRSKHLSRKLEKGEVVYIDENERQPPRSLHTHGKHDSTSENYLISAHYRCGDLSFVHKSEGFMSQACRFNRNSPEATSEYLRMVGTPVDVAVCVNEVLRNYTHELGATEFSELKNISRSLLVTASDSLTHTHSRLPPLLYIASDNDGASEQIAEESLWNHTYISPSGCHVELDKSPECFLLTVSYWFILSLSNVIVTQTSDGGLPVSAFSRFAAVYGLRGDTIRDCHRCGDTLTRNEMSRLQMGNWFCR